MTHRSLPRALFLTVSLAALGACTTSEFDWDLRSPGMGLDTTAAARQATAAPPQPDNRGVLSYPGYQVVLARRGDTVSTVAARLGIDAGELARYNAVQPGDSLRAGEILALPRRISEPLPGSPGSTGVLVGGPTGGGIDVGAIATTAIDRAEGAPVPAATAPQAPAAREPIRHRVARGETASTIARSYNVSTRALADWNGLGPDLGVREGQYLL
ncbi:MAG TPA: LysM peptidoglycan-binding domain-containing protein, partial [Paracoccaceae bacterium]|nr:LysM peptidoglycan-binding domain-containing protein [Paracoccaceae bacterium]